MPGFYRTKERAHFVLRVWFKSAFPCQANEIQTQLSFRVRNFTLNVQRRRLTIWRLYLRLFLKMEWKLGRRWQRKEVIWWELLEVLKGRKRPLISKCKRPRVCVPVTGFDATAACRSVRTDTEIYLSRRIGFSLLVHTHNCLLSYLNEDIP